MLFDSYASTTTFVICGWIHFASISDIGEKSRQVSIMLQIFQKAKRVLVWLGLAEGDAFRTLSSLKLLSGYNTSEIISPQEQNMTGNGYQAHQILCNYHREWLIGGVTRLLEKPW